jgi:hypothetical protein
MDHRCEIQGQEKRRSGVSAAWITGVRFSSYRTQLVTGQQFDRHRAASGMLKPKQLLLTSLPGCLAARAIRVKSWWIQDIGMDAH